MTVSIDKTTASDTGGGRAAQPAAGGSGTGAAHPWRIVSVLAAAGILASLTQTLVIPLLGQLPGLLHTDAAGASWVVTVTLLVGAVSTPVAGRLGDLYGKRRMLMVSLLPLIVGSVVAALASSLVPMIIGRGLQGLAMGMIPLGISLLRDVLPEEKVGTAIALMSSSMGIGGALGLPLAAAVAEFADWRWLFYLTAAATVLVLVLVWTLIPDAAVDRGEGRFDVLGAAGLAAALVCLLLPISKGADWGWASPTTLALFVASAVLLVVWGWWQLHTTSPLVDLRVTARGPVFVTNAASVVIGMAMYAQTLVIPQIMELPSAIGYGLGQTMLQMGLWMAPQGLAMMAVSSLGARISRALGPKFTLAIGSGVIAVGYAGAVVLMGSTWGLMIASVVCGAGVGLAYGAMPALIMANVPHSETASANGVNSLMRSIGTSVSAAVVGAVLAAMSTRMGGIAVPSQSGFVVGLFIGCGVSVIAAVLALLIPVGRRRRSAA